MLIGQELPQTTIDSLRMKLPLYELDSTELVVRQGLNAKNEIDIAQIKASILEDVFQSAAKGDTVAVVPQKIDLAIPDLRKELVTLYPEMQWYSLSQGVVHSLDSTRVDTISLFSARFSRPFYRGERVKLAGWLKQRIPSDSVKILIE